jgi:hypothetical protein
VTSPARAAAIPLQPRDRLSDCRRIQCEEAAAVAIESVENEGIT